MISTSLNMQRRLAVLSACAAFLPAAALAHDDHGKPQFGGLVAEGGAFQLELVLKPKQIALHISDHGKPVDVKGGTAKLTLLAGTAKTEVQLIASGSKFEASGDFATAKGTKAVAVVTLPGKKAVTARFQVK